MLRRSVKKLLNILFLYFQSLESTRRMMALCEEVSSLPLLKIDLLLVLTKAAFMQFEGSDYYIQVFYFGCII